MNMQVKWYRLVNLFPLIVELFVGGWSTSVFQRVFLVLNVNLEILYLYMCILCCVAMVTEKTYSIPL